MAAVPVPPQSGEQRPAADSVPAATGKEPPVASITSTPPRAIIVEE
ncbi:MAG: hypothetical protein HKO57_10825 [Akkermansiaceae bacterium]|nr:hypothetical protein [Akkermansiaceae bacterium]